MSIPNSTYFGIALQAIFGLGMPAAMFLCSRLRNLLQIPLRFSISLL